MSLEANQRVGPYDLNSLLGRGAFGEVWLARHYDLGSECALKIPTDPQYVRQLRKESKVIYFLDHENIVRGYGADSRSEPPYVAMEYVAGMSLRQKLKGGKLAPTEAIGILRQVLAALAYAHDQKIIHRDLKPENILLDVHGRVKVTDFGLGKIQSVVLSQSIVFSKSLVSDNTRNVAGTVYYMSPQQKAGKEPDVRDDLYAVGVIACELLTGSRPEPGRGLRNALVRTGADERFAQILEKALEPEREERYASAFEMFEGVSVAAGGGRSSTALRAPKTPEALDAYAIRWRLEKEEEVATLTAELKRKELELSSLRAKSAEELEAAKRVTAEATERAKGVQELKFEVQSKESQLRIMRSDLEGERASMHATFEAERTSMRAELVAARDAEAEAKRETAEVWAKLKSPEQFESLRAKVMNEIASKEYSAAKGTVMLMLAIWPGRDEMLAFLTSILNALPVITNSLGAEFKQVMAGTFLMGSPETEGGRGSDETQHQIKIPRMFYMAATPVTQAQWWAVMGTDPSHFRGHDLPVEQVSWVEAVEYCQRLSEREKRDGHRYRLPTEAEWEYACRAGTITRFYTGNGEIASGGWYDDNSKRRTRAVGQKKPNAWGFYDMHGNVWEWCGDRYGPYLKGGAAEARGTDSGSSRVLRGGSWRSQVSRCRSANRYSSSLDCRSNEIGFRLCLSVEQPVIV